MISKIVVPTDGSKVAQKAAKYAVDLAKQTGASLTLLSIIDKRFVVSQSVSPSASPTHLREPVEDYLKQEAKYHTQEIERLCKRNHVKFSSVIKSGHPVEEIVKEAEKMKADLVVMGSHGQSALRAAVLGSVTFGVAHKATKIPVLIVRR
jgi:nucleotide-binding universal stress UspA family protein